MPRRKPPRRRRPPGRDPASGRPASDPPLEAKRDGRWHVRRVRGSSSVATYTCPGCHRPIPPATPHVVAWPEIKALLSAEAVDERRHWHTTCWQRRA